MTSSLRTLFGGLAVTATLTSVSLASSFPWQAVPRAVDASTTTTRDVPPVVLASASKVATILVYNDAAELVSQGSGFILQGELLITNWHVVQGGCHVQAKMQDGVNLSADLVAWKDELNDLVAMRIAPHEQTPLSDKARSLELNSESIAVGTQVFVAGSPRGYAGTITEGIISAIRRTPDDRDVVQLTAPISPGSSGSPVLDSSGHVLAIVNYTIEESQLLNFATPARTISAMTLDAGQSLCALGRVRGPATAAEAADAIRQFRETLAELIERTLAERMPAIDSTSGISMDAVTARASYVVPIESCVSTLRSPKPLVPFELRSNEGWPEVESPWARLQMFAQMGLDDQQKQTLLAASFQLVCEYPSEPEAWKLLLIVDPVSSFLAPYKGRALFELTQLCPDDPLIRMLYLSHYYFEMRGIGSEVPDCPSDAMADLFGSSDERRASLFRRVHQLAEFDRNRTLLQSWSQWDDRVTSMPEFLHVLSILYGWHAVTTAGVTDEQVMLQWEQDCQVKEPYLVKALVDQFKGARPGLSVARDHLRRSLQLAERKRTASQLRGELFVAGEADSDRLRLAQWALLLGDTASALADQSLVAKRIRARLEEQLSDRRAAQSKAAQRTDAWESMALDRCMATWKSYTDVACTLARMNALADDEASAVAVLNAAAPAVIGTLVSEADRLSPVYESTTRSIEDQIQNTRAFLQVDD